MKSKKHIRRQITKIFLLMTVLFAFYAAILPENARAFKTNSIVSETANQDDFDKKFREGRDLIDREEWAKAGEKFSEVIGKYPNNKSIDAALYWLALCQKKLNKLAKADATLDRLLKEFPYSTWAADAKVMKMEMGSSFYNNNNKGLFASLSKNNESAGFVNVLNDLQKTPLDREDEIKLAAFQSLLSADPKRAIETLGGILKSDSTAGETFKREALRVIRSPRFNRNQNVTSGAFTSVFSVSGGLDEKFVPLLRETLIKSYQTEPSIKIRQEIIYALANMYDEQATNSLAGLYVSENNKEIKKAIINSFGGSQGNLFGFSAKVSPTRKLEFDKLWEIVRTEKDSELKQLALSSLQRFGGFLAKAEIIDALSKMYDAETEEQFKTTIIRTLAGIKQNQAAKKLFDIAKNEKSDKLKIEAIRSLRTSNDAEVLQFLENLIK